MVCFKKILEMKDDDKPTLNLVSFMSETNFIAPVDWKGYKYF